MKVSLVAAIISESDYGNVVTQLPSRCCVVTFRDLCFPALVVEVVVASLSPYNVAPLAALAVARVKKRAMS